MAIPRLITVTGTVLSPAGTPVVGAVLTFSNNPMVRDSATDDVMPANQSITQTTGANGEISLAVPCTDDPAFTPSGWTWMLTLTVPGSPTEFYPVSVPYAAPGATVKLSQLLPAASSGGMTSYATLAQLAEYIDPAELAAALEDYLPKTGGSVSGSLTVEGVLAVGAAALLQIGADTNLYRAGPDNLATDDAFSVGGKLLAYGDAEVQGNLIAPKVADSTLTVKRTAGGAARWRATGAALDIEIVGDVIESRRANQDFTGTQTNLRRMRNTGNTLVGRTEFGSTPYASEFFVDVDAASAKLPGTAFTGSIAGPVISPGDHGLAGWTFPPDMVQAGTILPTAGLSYVVRVRALSATITNLHVHFTVAGATLANCFMSLHTDAGVLLNANAVSADQSSTGSNWQASGFKTVPLLAPQAVTPGSWYKVRWWVGSAVTLPTLSRAINSNTVITNANLSAPNFRYATADAGLTTAALAPTTLGTLTGGNTAWWVGLS